ncbi:TIGR04282 family arsenosugar biosynthesis glycosyltransferase [Alloalcanivorax venustensis]|jgi:rSAM/selenodomain-associated transferase 1|uniref:TIGR04282 family arsenosugar biosynthesis glycosyltransferase n=1 Tax=Alloalcanivorax TaxID=3020832 RepID=UPI002EA28412|nr:TIGR04282 family arsenosugar biosynthesis glycosyltransferase [Pseudomonadota bacterium]
MAAERAPAIDTLLLVFARAPRRGRVKTRLVPELGEDTALDVHQRLLDRTLREAAAFPGRARLMLDDHDDRLAAHAGEIGLEVGLQHGGGLGERMNAALRDGLQEAPRVLLVGSDCPVLDQTYLALAVDGLDNARVVLGASEDGGYVLIGGSDASVWHDGRFEGVRLGTDYAMADTLVALNDVAPVTVLPPLWDVDIPEDVTRARNLGVLP